MTMSTFLIKKLAYYKEHINVKAFFNNRLEDLLIWNLAECDRYKNSLIS